MYILRIIYIYVHIQMDNKKINKKTNSKLTYKKNKIINKKI